MSRSLVSKLLSKARKIGIVEIIIHEEFHPYRKLEEELKKRFQIKEAVCVSVENSEIPVNSGSGSSKYLARKAVFREICGNDRGKYYTPDR